MHGQPQAQLTDDDDPLAPSGIDSYPFIYALYRRERGMCLAVLIRRRYEQDGLKAA